MNPEDAKWEELQTLIDESEITLGILLEIGNDSLGEKDIQEMAELYNTIQDAKEIMDAHSKGQI